MTQLDPYVYGSVTLTKYIPTTAKLGVLVGVLRGVDAEVLLNHFDGTLILVDDWSLRGLPDGFADSAQAVRAQAHERLAPYLDRVRWLECTSVAAHFAMRAWRWADFVYLDGDHSEIGVTADIKHWRSVIDCGGILAGHDYGHPDFPGVKRAVDALLPDAQKDGTVWIHRID